MASLPRRLRGGTRRHSPGKRPLRVPLVHGDSPANVVAELIRASRRGVAVKEAGGYYLLTPGVLGEGVPAGRAGGLARSKGRVIAPGNRAARQAMVEGPWLADADAGIIGKGDLPVGEAILSARLEMIVANLRAPVAVVVCSRNPRHVYDAARRLKACPLDGADLTRLERD